MAWNGFTAVAKIIPNYRVIMWQKKTNHFLLLRMVWLINCSLAQMNYMTTLWDTFFHILWSMSHDHGHNTSSWIILILILDGSLETSWNLVIQGTIATKVRVTPSKNLNENGWKLKFFDCFGPPSTSLLVQKRIAIRSKNASVRQNGRKSAVGCLQLLHILHLDPAERVSTWGRMTPGNQSAIRQNGGKSRVGCLKFLYILKSTLYFARITTKARVTPSNNCSIGQDRRKGSSSSLNLHDIYQLMLYLATISPWIRMTPTYHRSILPNRRKGAGVLSTGGLNFLHLPKLILNQTAISTKGWVTPSDHAAILTDRSKGTIGCLDFHHMDQLICNLTAVPTKGIMAPRDHGTVRSNRCKGTACGLHLAKFVSSPSPRSTKYVLKNYPLLHPNIFFIAKHHFKLLKKYVGISTSICFFCPTCSTFFNRSTTWWPGDPPNSGCPQVTP